MEIDYSLCDCDGCLLNVARVPDSYSCNNYSVFKDYESESESDLYCIEALKPDEAFDSHYI